MASLQPYRPAWSLLTTDLFHITLWLTATIFRSQGWPLYTNFHQLYLWWLIETIIIKTSKPLNCIILGQRQTDFNYGLIIISEWVSTYIKYDRGFWDFFNVDKFDRITQLITLSVIPWSGAQSTSYCLRHTESFQLNHLLIVTLKKNLIKKKNIWKDFLVFFCNYQQSN